MQAALPWLSVIHRHPSPWVVVVEVLYPQTSLCCKILKLTADLDCEPSIFTIKQINILLLLLQKIQYILLTTGLLFF